MNMGTNTNLTRMQSIAASTALFRSAMNVLWDTVNAGGWWSGDVSLWLVDLRLNCRSCDNYTVARCELRSFLELDKEIKANHIKCGCGGVLTQESTLVKIAVVKETPLDKLIVSS